MAEAWIGIILVQSPPVKKKKACYNPFASCRETHDWVEGTQMVRFKPVRQGRISEEIAQQLKESILLGLFKPGDRLPSERDLADQFKVSRVVIREALRALENLGFILTRQGAAGGAFVTDLTFERLARAFLDLFLAGKISIPEMYEVRRLVEPEVARLAAQRINADYSRRLKEALEAEQLPAVSFPEDFDRKTKVHLLLAEMCGNRFFEALVRSAMELTMKVIEAVQPDPMFIHPAGLHRPIVEAVLAGNPQEAARAMRKHTDEFGETLIKMEAGYREKHSSFPMGRPGS
jgi:GntR family transcriptional repressor for pyruvate dehydrogenase complex